MAGIFEHENANDSSMTFPRFSATFLNVKNKFFENNFWPILDAANTFFYPKLKDSAENTHHWGRIAVQLVSSQCDQIGQFNGL